MHGENIKLADEYFWVWKRARDDLVFNFLRLTFRLLERSLGVIFFYSWPDSPYWARAPSLSRLDGHTQTLHNQ